MKRREEMSKSRNDWNTLIRQMMPPMNEQFAELWATKNSSPVETHFSPIRQVTRRESRDATESKARISGSQLVGEKFQKIVRQKRMDVYSKEKKWKVG